ncbi:MAG: phosphotransferase [Tissierellia bacterium]|nr:phosphotransferase [Tissierellia bacterium]
MNSLLKENYNIDTISVEQIQGGWSALAYVITSTDGHKYLLKVYEKSRASTSTLTANIEKYMPIVEWLNNNTILKDKIIKPFRTLQSNFKCEDDKNIYLLSTYIEGENLIGKELSNNQVKDLAKIVAELHSHGEDIPLDLSSLKEDFSVAFTNQIREHLESISKLKPALQELLELYKKYIGSSIHDIEELSTKLPCSNYSNYALILINNFINSNIINTTTIIIVKLIAIIAVCLSLFLLSIVLYENLIQLNKVFIFTYYKGLFLK